MPTCEICGKSLKNNQALGAHKLWIHGLPGRKNTSSPSNRLVNDHKVILDIQRAFEAVHEWIKSHEDTEKSRDESRQLNYEQIKRNAEQISELMKRLNDVERQVIESVALMADLKDCVKDISSTPEAKPILSAQKD